MNNLDPVLRDAALGHDDALTTLGLCLQATHSDDGHQAALATARELELDGVRSLDVRERLAALRALHAHLTVDSPAVVRALWALRQAPSDDALRPIQPLLEEALALDPDGLIAEQALSALLLASSNTARAAATRAASAGTGDVADVASRWLALHGV
jgi:hypothetical protein